ncbi:hypothetical protein UFOVP806_2 [uncultured Caudovirales phage]|uniref:Uncharacterized protein n=1 Tax=uncultured Caudovirales phage TaxID=2100421 RepID=A0A6J5P202_9CAUD|nr:hypothetical protein UFOVP806_2 [uncultured Caudovirales phage]
MSSPGFVLLMVVVFMGLKGLEVPRLGGVLFSDGVCLALAFDVVERAADGLDVRGDAHGGLLASSVMSV